MSRGIGSPRRTRFEEEITLQQPFMDLVAGKKSFLLTGHEHPDGDCLGAEVAMYHLLRSMGKQVVILNPDPIARSHDFLLQHTPIQSYEPGMEIPEVDVLVLLDCAVLSRLGALGERLRGIDATIAVVDHHVDSDSGDGQVLLVDSGAAATGLLVYGLYAALQVKLELPAAEGVFLSLVSDTGWFRYSNTGARELAIAAELLAVGVNASQLYDRLFRRQHSDSLDYFATVLTGCRRGQNGRFALATLDRAMVDRAGRIGFDTDQLLDSMRSVEGTEVAALFKERLDGTVKLSLRAAGDVDVYAIATKLGGGGHRKASGATLTMPMDEAVTRVEELVRVAIDGSD